MVRWASDSDGAKFVYMLKDPDPDRDPGPGPGHADTKLGPIITNFLPQSFFSSLTSSSAFGESS